jgi:hypothetical protein
MRSAEPARMRRDPAKLTAVAAGAPLYVLKMKNIARSRLVKKRTIVYT